MGRLLRRGRRGGVAGALTLTHDRNDAVIAPAGCLSPPTMHACSLACAGHSEGSCQRHRHPRHPGAAASDAPGQLARGACICRCGFGSGASRHDATRFTPCRTISTIYQCTRSCSVTPPARCRRGSKRGCSSASARASQTDDDDYLAAAALTRGACEFIGACGLGSRSAGVYCPSDVRCAARASAAARSRLWRRNTSRRTDHVLQQRWAGGLHVRPAGRGHDVDAVVNHERQRRALQRRCIVLLGECERECCIVN